MSNLPSPSRGAQEDGPILGVRLATARPACMAALVGELDISTAPLVEALAEPVNACCGRLVVDMGGCTFLDAAGCSALRSLAARLTSLRLVGVSPLARRVLELTGSDHLFAESGPPDEEGASAP